MPAVLVHGVPETERVWDQLRARLTREDVVTLSLPGFGQPRPVGFGSTMDDYVEWLVDQVAGIDEPVDLVGHDWGGAFVVRLVSLRPELVRSWVTDATGLTDPEFEWHQFALLWQTPDEGEAFMEAVMTSAETRTNLFTAAGASPESALVMATAFDRTMADSILALYRSATKVNEEWGPAFVDIASPGLVIVPSDDAYIDPGLTLRAAERAGARSARLDGVGHWWMLSEPDRSARLLEEFWASVA